MKSNDVEVEAAYRWDGILWMTKAPTAYEKITAYRRNQNYEGWTRPRRQMGITSKAFGLAVSEGEKN